MSIKEKFEKHPIIFLVGLITTTIVSTLTGKEALDAYFEKHNAKQAEMIKRAVDEALARSDERLQMLLASQRQIILADLRDTNEELLAKRENSAIANALSVRGGGDGGTYRNTGVPLSDGVDFGVKEPKTGRSSFSRGTN